MLGYTWNAVTKTKRFKSLFIYLLAVYTTLERFTALTTDKQPINLTTLPYSKNNTKKSATYDECKKQDLKME